jgi:choline dehydrogenase-like flavoprotein
MQQPEINPHYLENDFGVHDFPLDYHLITRTPTDLEMLVQHLKFVRTLAEVEPWKSTLGREVGPGATCTTDEEIRGSFIYVDVSSVPDAWCRRIYQGHSRHDLVRSSVSTDFFRNAMSCCRHTIGSCSMMPREKQGVVDPELTVTASGVGGERCLTCLRSGVWYPEPARR